MSLERGAKAPLFHGPVTFLNWQLSGGLSNDSAELCSAGQPGAAVPRL